MYPPPPSPAVRMYPIPLKQNRRHRYVVGKKKKVLVIHTGLQSSTGSCARSTILGTGFLGTIFKKIGSCARSTILGTGSLGTILKNTGSCARSTILGTGSLGTILKNTGSCTRSTSLGTGSLGAILKNEFLISSVWCYSAYTIRGGYTHRITTITGAVCFFFL